MNVNSSFFVKVYVFFPSLFNILTPSLLNKIVATTFSFVLVSGLYVIVPFNASATENVVLSACPPTIVALAISLSPKSSVLISIEFPSLDN